MTTQSDEALVEIAERVLAQRLDTAFGLANAACPSEEQRKGIYLLWLHIGQSHGQFRGHAIAIETAYREGMSLSKEVLP